MQTVNLVSLLAEEYSAEEWEKHSVSLNKNLQRLVKENDEPASLATELLALTKPIQVYIMNHTDLDQVNMAKRLINIISSLSSINRMILIQALIVHRGLNEFFFDHREVEGLMEILRKDNFSFSQEDKRFFRSISDAILSRNRSTT